MVSQEGARNPDDQSLSEYHDKQSQTTAMKLSAKHDFPGPDKAILISYQHRGSALNLVSVNPKEYRIEATDTRGPLVRDVLRLSDIMSKNLDELLEYLRARAYECKACPKPQREYGYFNPGVLSVRPDTGFMTPWIGVDEGNYAAVQLLLQAKEAANLHLNFRASDEKDVVEWYTRGAKTVVQRNGKSVVIDATASEGQQAMSMRATTSDQPSLWRRLIDWLSQPAIKVLLVVLIPTSPVIASVIIGIAGIGKT